MFTEKISQEQVDEIKSALEINTGRKSTLSNLELKAIIYYGNKIIEEDKITQYKEQKGYKKWLEQRL